MENPWLAFIPLLNLMMMCAMIDKPVWYAVLFFVPLLSIVWMLVVWIRIAQLCGKPAWLGAFIILPFINLLMMTYLAFSGLGGEKQQPEITVPKPSTETQI